MQAAESERPVRGPMDLALALAVREQLGAIDLVVHAEGLQFAPLLGGDQRHARVDRRKRLDRLRGLGLLETGPALGHGVRELGGALAHALLGGPLDLLVLDLAGDHQEGLLVALGVHLGVRAAVTLEALVGLDGEFQILEGLLHVLVCKAIVGRHLVRALLVGPACRRQDQALDQGLVPRIGRRLGPGLVARVGHVARGRPLGLRRPGGPGAGRSGGGLGSGFRGLHRGLSLGPGGHEGQIVQAGPPVDLGEPGQAAPLAVVRGRRVDHVPEFRVVAGLRRGQELPGELGDALAHAVRLDHLPGAHLLREAAADHDHRQTRELEGADDGQGVLAQVAVLLDLQGLGQDRRPVGVPAEPVRQGLGEAGVGVQDQAVQTLG